MITKAELEQFIQDVMDAGNFDGCRYQQLDDEYYLVFAWIPGFESADLELDYENYYLCGKIAYNCDDLQCDYDWDWLRPEVNGDVLDTEISDCLDMPVAGLAEDFYGLYQSVLKVFKNS